MISYNCSDNQKHIKIYVKKVESGLAIRCINSLTEAESVVIITNSGTNLQTDWTTDCSCYDSEQSKNLSKSREGNVKKELPKNSKQIPSYLREDILIQNAAHRNYVSFTIPRGVVHIYHPKVGGKNYKNNSDRNTSTNVNHIILSFDLPPLQVEKKTTATQTRKHYALKRSEDKNSTAFFSIEPLFQLSESILSNKQNQTDAYFESQITQTYSKISAVDCGTQTDNLTGYSTDISVAGLVNKISLSKRKLNEINLVDVKRNCSENLLYPFITTAYSGSSTNSLKTYDSHSHFASGQTEVTESHLNVQDTLINLSKRITPTTLLERSIEYFSDGCISSESMKSRENTYSLVTLFNNITNCTISHSSNYINKWPTMKNLCDKNSEHIDDDKEFSYKSVTSKSCRELGGGQNIGPNQSKEMFKYESSPLPQSSSLVMHPKPHIEYRPVQTKLSRSNVSSRHISALLTNTKEYPPIKLAVDTVNRTISKHFVCHNIDNELKSLNFFKSLQNHGTISSLNSCSVVNPNTTTRNFDSHEVDINSEFKEPITFLCDCCGILNLAMEATSHNCGECKKNQHFKDKDSICKRTNKYLNSLSSANIVNTNYKSIGSIRNSVIFYNKTFAASSPILRDSRPTNLIVNYDKIIKGGIITGANQSDKTNPTVKSFYNNSKINKRWAVKNSNIGKKYNDDYYQEFMTINSFGNCSITKCTFTKSCQNHNLNQNSGVIVEKKAELVCFEERGRDAKSLVDFRVISRTTKGTNSEFSMENTGVKKIIKRYPNVSFITLKNELSEPLIEMSKTHKSLNMFGDSLMFQQRNYSLSSTLHIVPSSLEVVLIQEAVKPIESRLIWENTLEHKKFVPLDGQSNYFGTKEIEKDTQQISSITNKRFLSYAENKSLIVRNLMKIPQLFNKKHPIKDKTPKISLVNITKISSKNKFTRLENKNNNQASSNEDKKITRTHSTEIKDPTKDLGMFSKELSTNKLLLNVNKNLKIKTTNKEERFWKRKFWITSS